MQYSSWLWLFFLLGMNGLAQTTDTLYTVVPATDTVYTAHYLKKSTSFAWTTFGGDLLTLTGGKADYMTSANAVRTTTFGNSVIPRLTIGGVHFWGHADFYVTFPIPISVGSRPAAFSKFSYLQGIESGARFYPIKLRSQSIRPYLGISFRRIAYRHQSEGISYEKQTPEYDRFVSPVQAGVTYASKKYLFSAGIHYIFNNEAQYAISPTSFGNVTFNPLSINIGILRYVDTDRYMTAPRSVKLENERIALLDRYKRISAWYIGLGPSAGLQMSKSSFFKKKYPYFYEDMTGGFMPDLTFGYYFGKLDANAGLSYRTMGEKLEAFDSALRMRRHSVMLETYKFLFNYLGFVPYLGPTLSVERLSFSDNGKDLIQTKLAVGIIAGWDIRVTRTGASLLRTNLRWIPDLHLTAEGEKVMFNHFEFNFIQWVQFLGRKKFYRRHSL